MTFVFRVLFLIGCILLAPFVSSAQNVEGLEFSRYYYSGNIGGIDKVHLNIYLNDLVVTGGIVLENKNEYYFLEGRMAYDRSGVGLRIYDSKNIFIGTLQLKAYSEEGDLFKVLKGKFFNVDNGLRYNLVVQKIAQYSAAPGVVSAPPGYRYP